MEEIDREIQRARTGRRERSRVYIKGTDDEKSLLYILSFCIYLCVTVLFRKKNG